MADSTLNRFLASGTAVQKAAFTPTPPSPASGPSPGYTWWDSTNQTLYCWDSGSASWKAAVTVGAPALTLISEQTPSGTGVVSFTSLGSTRSLRITGMARGTAAATGVTVRATFNSDTGSNYDSQRVYGIGTGANASNTNSNAQAYVYAADIAAASATSGVATAFILDIYDFAGTTFQKTTTGQYSFKQGTATSDQMTVLTAGFWRNTAAITRIDLTLSSGNWASGSRVSLYGVN